MVETFAPNPRAELRRITRRDFLTAGAAAAVGVLGYSATHARHQLEVISLDMPVRNLPDAFVGFRVVQISDIHLHEYCEPWFFEQVIERVNGLRPDLVLFTGDLISDGPRHFPFAWKAAGEAAEIMSRLKAPRFAIPGNHDDAVGVRHVIEPLESHGTPVLSDSYTSIERGSGRFWLCGTPDIIYHRPNLTNAIPADPKAPVILMAHEPDYADYVTRHPHGKNVDLMLSGHTHGGQVRVPVIGPFVLPVLGRKYVHGQYHVGNMQLYVNRGIGTTGFSMRLNCPAEITQFRLVRA